MRVARRCEGGPTCRCGPRRVGVDRDVSVWTETCRCGPRRVGVDRDVSVWTETCRCGPRRVGVDDELRLHRQVVFLVETAEFAARNRIFV